MEDHPAYGEGWETHGSPSVINRAVAAEPALILATQVVGETPIHRSLRLIRGMTAQEVNMKRQHQF